MNRLRSILIVACLALIGGCTSQESRTEQKAGGDARSETSNSVVRASVDALGLRLATIEQRLEQRQSGIINIATSGSGIGAYLFVVAASLAAWKLYRRSSYWKDSARRIVKVIEKENLDACVKQKLAKINAQTTPLGQLVQRETTERKISA